MTSAKVPTSDSFTRGSDTGDGVLGIKRNAAGYANQPVGDLPQTTTGRANLTKASKTIAGGSFTSLPVNDNPRKCSY